MPERPRRRVDASALSAAAALLFLALSIQIITGAYEAEFGGHPDEAAHVVTGLMVRDYLAAFPAGNPMAYAQGYYDTFPKVALGNWPPGLYALQAIVTLILPRQPETLILLQAVLTAGVALMLFLLLRQAAGGLRAFIAAAVFLLLPTTIEAVGLVMTEPMVALGVALAVAAFLRWLERPCWLPALAFALFASAAILTKASALALALVPPLAILFLRRWSALREPSLWLAAVVVAVLCAPWTWYTLGQASAGWQEGGLSWAYSSSAIPYYSQRLGHILGVPLLLAGITGLLVRGLLPETGRRHRLFWAVVSAWALAVPLLHFLVPAGLEPRHLLPALPAWIILAVGGLREIARSLAARLGTPTPVFELTFAILALGWFGVASFELRHKAYHGFDAVHAQISSRGWAPGSRVLVSSDARGEGMFIAAAALRDRTRTIAVDRTSKILASSTWSGAQYESFHADTGAIATELERRRYRAVIVDTSLPADRRRPHHSLLEQTLASDPRRFPLLASYPVERPEHRSLHGIKVYLIAASAPLP